VDGAVSPRRVTPETSSLEGRTAVVTGAGQGVGKGIALALAAAGANVVIAARRAATGDPVAAEINRRAGHASSIQTDVTRRADVEAMVVATVDTYGGLDVMVHNAFKGGLGHRLEDVTAEAWTDFSRTAVWASFYCAQLAYAHLRRSRAGRLVLVSSPAGVEGSVNIPVYAPVKAAQRSMVKSLAREWGADGITVNCIAPVAASPALSAAFRQNPVLEERLSARAALGRIGDPEVDIGSVVAWLASDAAGYVTGQTIVCDGGSFIGL
jgi:3-oxoacyl-[acyl-carrier protein] reductase